MLLPREALGPSAVDPDERLSYLRDTLMPSAIQCLNGELATGLCACYEDEILPTNQRNLTDFRTRIGTLLEQLLAACVNRVVEANGGGVRLTHVVANKFPDLSFRCDDGALGVRLEVKSIEAVAEEKSANFDTLIKDIRKGMDFLVIMLWEWEPSEGPVFRWPRVRNWVVLDAFTMARIRDCVWLGNPPAQVGDARQGFDLCFGVNCRRGRYNREEGNYGKLMRLCRAEDVALLPADLRDSVALGDYLAFKEKVVDEGFLTVIDSLAADLAAACGQALEVRGRGADVGCELVVSGRRIVVVVGEGMPALADVDGVGNADLILMMNHKFDWRLRDPEGVLIARGRKPDEAMAALRAWADQISPPGRPEG